MTERMRGWLRDHGLTATQVADKAGVSHRDLYDELNGKKPVEPELTTTLRRIYGMSEQEYREAVPGC